MLLGVNLALDSKYLRGNNPITQKDIDHPFWNMPQTVEEDTNSTEISTL